MAQKYTLAPSGTAFDRLVGGNAIHLSDGTLVFIYKSATGAWNLAYTTDRATINTIGALSVGTAAGTFLAATGAYGLCRDASDNVYVFGPQGNSSSSLAAQAWTKGTGYAWTPGSIVGAASTGTVGDTFAVWSNTGGGTGGKGHLVVAHSSGSRAWVLDAGALLAGTFTATTSNVALSGAASDFSASSGQTTLHVVADGFGALNGLFVGKFSGSASVTVTAWSITTAGVLSQTSLSGMTPTGSGAIKVRGARYAAGAYLVVIGDLGGTNFHLARYSNTTQTTAQVNYAASNVATNNTSADWDIFLDPVSANQVWMIGLTASTGVVTRAPVSVGSGISVGTPITDDTFTSWVSTGFQLDLVAVTAPSGSRVDWLVNGATTGPSYALLGDYTAFNSAPNAPTLGSPATGSTIDRTITQRFTWTFSDPDAGDSQSAFDLRYSSDGGSTWTTVSGTTTNQYVDIASGTFTATNYQWQVRTYDHLGAVGPYSASSFFTAATPPAAVTITAPTSGSTIGSASYTVTWSAPTQTDYQVRIVGDLSGSADTSTIYSDTGDVVDSTSRSRTMPFTNNGIYVHVQVRIKANGLWSSWADARALVSYTPPATPTLTVAAGTAWLVVTPTQPTPTGGQPTVTSIDIYRRVNGDGSSGQRYVTGASPTAAWTDYRVASKVNYQYLVRAFGSNGTYTDSAWTA